MSQITSSELAKKCNVTKKTLRHYECIELLLPKIDKSNGYWFYEEDDITKLNTIRSLRVLGLSLKEIKSNFDSNFKELRENADEKLEEIENKVKQLNQVKELLVLIRDVEGDFDATTIYESLEEQHLKWYRENLSLKEFEILKNMETSEDAIESHEIMINSMQLYKKAFSNGSDKGMTRATNKILQIFTNKGVSLKASIDVLGYILKSDGESPEIMQILNMEERKRMKLILSKL